MASYTCQLCGSEFSSVAAWMQCEDDDAAQDTNNRQWLANARQIRD